MSAKIPQSSVETKMCNLLKANGYNRVSQGKVRDTYRVSDKFLLQLATDRISIFDFVLSALVIDKGNILTALTHYWMTQVFPGFPNHLVSGKDGINAVHELAQDIPELDMGRCLLVQDLGDSMINAELIFRHHIGGSVYSNYLENGMAGGQKIKPNLAKWAKLNEPIFTPSTKEEVGHDINYDAAEFFSQHGEVGEKWISTLSSLYSVAYRVAAHKGIRILDTKFESTFGILADEILTPDSSRFVDDDNWLQAMEESHRSGKNVDPDFMDKEVVRIWGKSVETPFGVTGIHRLDPKDPEHVNFVHSLTVPEKIISDTTTRYHEIFTRLTGKALMSYQSRVMKI